MGGHSRSTCTGVLHKHLALSQRTVRRGNVGDSDRRRKLAAALQRSSPARLVGISAVGTRSVRVRPRRVAVCARGGGSDGHARSGAKGFDRLAVMLKENEIIGPSSDHVREIEEGSQVRLVVGCGSAHLVEERVSIVDPSDWGQRAGDVVEHALGDVWGRADLRVHCREGSAEIMQCPIGDAASSVEPDFGLAPCVITTERRDLDEMDGIR